MKHVAMRHVQRQLTEFRFRLNRCYDLQVLLATADGPMPRWRVKIANERLRFGTTANGHTG